MTYWRWVAGGAVVLATLMAAAAVVWLVFANPPVASAHTTGGINDCVPAAGECTTRGTQAPNSSAVFPAGYSEGQSYRTYIKGDITDLRFFVVAGQTGTRLLRLWLTDTCLWNGSGVGSVDAAGFQVTPAVSVTMTLSASGNWQEEDITDLTIEPDTGNGATYCLFEVSVDYASGGTTGLFNPAVTHDHDDLYVYSFRLYSACTTWRPGSGVCGGGTDVQDNSNQAGLDFVFVPYVAATATPTNTPTPTVTPTPTTTPTPTNTPTPTATPLPAPPSGGFWYIPDVAQAVRDLPTNLINAFATFTVPEPTAITAAVQTVEAGTAGNVSAAQETAIARWGQTVDIYDDKTAFVTEIGGILGEVKNALVDSTCGSTPIVVTVPLFGTNYTLNFFTAEQLNVWWCPVVKPLLEAAMYVLFSVSALMLWMRFRRSGGNE